MKPLEVNENVESGQVDLGERIEQKQNQNRVNLQIAEDPLK